MLRVQRSCWNDVYREAHTRLDDPRSVITNPKSCWRSLSFCSYSWLVYSMVVHDTTYGFRTHDQENKAFHWLGNRDVTSLLTNGMDYFLSRVFQMDSTRPSKTYSSQPYYPTSIPGLSVTRDRAVPSLHIETGFEVATTKVFSIVLMFLYGCSKTLEICETSMEDGLLSMIFSELGEIKAQKITPP